MDTWVTENCAACGAGNHICLGDMTDQTARDVETFKCYVCGVVSKLPEACDERPTVADDDDQESYDEMGHRPPRYGSAIA